MRVSSLRCGARRLGLACGLLVFVPPAAAQDDSVLQEIAAIGRRADAGLRRVQLEFDRQRLEARAAARERIAAAKREIAAAAMRRDDSVHAAMFAAAEAEAELERRVIPRLDAGQQLAEAAIHRERTAAETAVHARTLDVGDPEQNARMRDYLRRSADIEQRWQERFDRLSYEWELALIELQREERRAHHAYDRDVKIVYERLQEAALAAGGDGAGLAADPRLTALAEKRDEVLNAIARRRDEAQLDHDTRRAEAEQGRDNELAAIAP